MKTYNREDFGEFILKEKKDGTKITVRDVQLVILDIMKDIDKVCKKHHINYCLTGGSTLGAVLYKGFIPWDDDMDIAMMREDYEKFLKVAVKDLDPDKYVVHCFEKNHKYDVTWPAMKIRKKGTYLKETNKLLFNKCKDCDGVFIDVFIYDHLSKHTVLDFPLRFINQILGNVITFFENLRINPVPLKYLFIGNAKLYGKLCKKTKYIGDDITWIYKSPFHPLRYVYKNMFPVTYLPFEDIELPVPNDYRDYLIRRYGEKCFTPLPKEKQRAKHIVDINLKSDKPEK